MNNLQKRIKELEASANTHTLNGEIYFYKVDVERTLVRIQEEILKIIDSVRKTSKPEDALDDLEIQIKGEKNDD